MCVCLEGCAGVRVCFVLFLPQNHSITQRPVSQASALKKRQNLHRLFCKKAMDSNNYFTFIEKISGFEKVKFQFKVAVRSKGAYGQ